MTHVSAEKVDTRGKKIVSDNQSQPTSKSCSTQTTSLHSEKDNALYDDPNLNLVIPNSDGEGDNDLVNENLSTLKIWMLMSVSVAPATVHP